MGVMASSGGTLKLADKDRITLRFVVGDRVQANCGKWKVGTIVKLFYTQRSFRPGMCVPYQIRLDEDERLIFAHTDDDKVVRAYDEQGNPVDRVDRGKYEKTVREWCRVEVVGVQSRPELNHRKGRIVSVDLERERCGVLMDSGGAPLSLKQSNVRVLTTEQEFVHAVRALSPSSLSALIDDVLAGTYQGRPWALDATYEWHLHVDHLDLWATDADVRAALASDRLSALVDAMTDAANRVGATCQSNLAIEPGGPTRVLHCVGCNTCYDAGGCNHPGTPDKLKLPIHGNWPQMHALVHSATLIMSLLIGFLGWPTAVGQETLLNLMVPEAPAGIKTQDYVMQCLTQGIQCPIVSLLGLVDNCTVPFPKVAHLAVSLLSLAVSRRPAAVLCLLDPDPTCKSLYNYLMPVFQRVNEIPCMVEERFGTVQLLNSIPLLYHLGDWFAVPGTPSCDLPPSLPPKRPRSPAAMGVPHASPHRPHLHTHFRMWACRKVRVRRHLGSLRAAGVRGYAQY